MQGGNESLSTHQDEGPGQHARTGLLGGGGGDVRRDDLGIDRLEGLVFGAAIANPEVEDKPANDPLHARGLPRSHRHSGGRGQGSGDPSRTSDHCLQYGAR